MKSNRERRGPLGVRVDRTASGIRIRGLGELALDPAEARALAEALTAAADAADIHTSQLVHRAGCTAHLEQTDQGVILHATHPTGQGRWLSAPHPLDGATYGSPADALRAAVDAGLVIPPVEAQ